MSGLVGNVGAGSNSGVIGGGYGRFDEWRMTTDVATSTGILGNGNVTNSVRHGLNVTVSSGIFTLPETGMYRIELTSNIIHNGSSSYPYGQIQVDFGADGSYTLVAQGMFQMANQGDNSYEMMYAHASCDCTAGDLVKFTPAGSSVTWQGSSTANYTYFRFTKINAT